MARCASPPIKDNGPTMSTTAPKSGVAASSLKPTDGPAGNGNPMETVPCPTVTAEVPAKASCGMLNSSGHNLSRNLNGRPVKSTRTVRISMSPTTLTNGRKASNQPAGFKPMASGKAFPCAGGQRVRGTPSSNSPFSPVQTLTTSPGVITVSNRWPKRMASCAWITQGMTPPSNSPPTLSLLLPIS